MKLLQQILLLFAVFMNVGIVLTSQSEKLEVLGIRLQTARNTLNHYEDRCKKARGALCEREQVGSGKTYYFDMLNVEYRSLQKIVRDHQEEVSRLEAIIDSKVADKDDA